MSSRIQLLDFLKETLSDSSLEIGDDTSLIQSGLLDSSALFNLALWIENHTNSPIDPASFDLRTEWDTMACILGFIEKQNGEAGLTKSSLPK